MEPLTINSLRMNNHRSPKRRIGDDRCSRQALSRTTMSVDSEEPSKRIVVIETCALFAKRVDEENGCNRSILLAGNYCGSGTMEKLVSNLTARNRGNAERTQQKTEALVLAWGREP